MIKPLLSVRFRSLFAQAATQRRKKRGAGTVVLLALLYVYLIAIYGGLMFMTFDSLAAPYHALGLDWLYFAMAGLMGLALAVFGSIFATQNQLYEAKDNELLLAMPLTPKAILASRMMPLLLLNLLFCSVVYLPAMAAYGMAVSFSLPGLLCQLLCLPGICILAQAIACFLGWLLHLLLRRMNKSVASMLYMILFLALYFSIYSQASSILNAMAQNGQAIAGFLHSWVWPLYAMGQGCVQNVLYLLGFLLLCAGIFAAVTFVLSATFLRTATMPPKSAKRRRLAQVQMRSRTPISSLVHKELLQFLRTPVFLTNMGLGIIMVAALAVAGIAARGAVLEFLGQLQIPASAYSLLICAMLCFLADTVELSTPLVSLEGKSIWIPQSAPLDARQILHAKLLFHCLLSMPVCAAAGLALSVAYGCTAVEVLLCTLIPALMALLCGLIGLLAGLQWVRLDYLSPAYPCKQSVAVLVGMLLPMGFVLTLGIAWAALSGLLTPVVFLMLCAVLFAALCAGLYRLLLTWGVRKWDALTA